MMGFTKQDENSAVCNHLHYICIKMASKITKCNKKEESALPTSKLLSVHWKQNLTKFGLWLRTMANSWHPSNSLQRTWAIRGASYKTSAPTCMTTTVSYWPCTVIICLHCYWARALDTQEEHTLLMPQWCERKLPCYKQLHQNMDISKHNPNALKKIIHLHS